jgi:hypothetical protein
MNIIFCFISEHPDPEKEKKINSHLEKIWEEIQSNQKKEEV